MPPDTLWEPELTQGNTGAHTGSQLPLWRSQFTLQTERGGFLDLRPELCSKICSGMTLVAFRNSFKWHTGNCWERALRETPMLNWTGYFHPQTKFNSYEQQTTCIANGLEKPGGNLSLSQAASTQSPLGPSTYQAQAFTFTFRLVFSPFTLRTFPSLPKNQGVDNPQKD